MSDDEEEDVVYGFGVGDEVELAPGWEDVDPDAVYVYVCMNE